MNDKKGLISYISYKDVLIILGIWYLMLSLNMISKGVNLDYTVLNNFFHFLFIISGRFLSFSFIVFYITSLYPISFADLGIHLKNPLRQLRISSSTSIALIILVIIFINIPLTLTMEKAFSPLIKVNSPEVFVTSILPLLLLIIANLVIALSEQLILVNIFYKLFSKTLFNKFISIIMSSLLYSFLLLNFDPGRILINFLAAAISLFIYSKTESILTSSFFIASYYSIYIIYIFGWNYIGF
ncbi:hypothetical protein GM661_15465 [Iocasia frigidifontis]|uniref:CAAX prenyl protease 2/Lysostaphin resistance protein A-like domain-containing protein n=1 Tax=Iocasia fonsfrigidae TaxID=2682810 RepID=A0A8A7KBN0_9FIRM|nr:CPBP family glutamic-type intramembrane protease [Iocasia fonsfrigidae]QTL99253.1 hypothetical protein GM661_15465 [Iocasia fonsfrigidae]